MTLTMRPTGLGHGVYKDSVDTGASQSRSIGRALPYVLSWAALGVLMVIGSERVPSALYRPVDGDWAKWNVEAILHFGKPFDLGPYSMLAGMGSMYFPNLPWLNPGAPALGLPLDGQTTSIVSYGIYAAELAISIIALARVIGFSWLMWTVAAQLYLYLLFPPFSEVFRIYDWYSLAPYYAHLQAALGGPRAPCLRAARRLAGKRTPGRRVLRAVCLRLAFGALYLRLRHPRLRGHLRGHDPHEAAVANRVGVEDCGARVVPDLHFCLRPSRLLSRHHGHGRTHADGPDRVGPAAVGGVLAASVSRSRAMQRLAAAAVHQRSWRLAADCRALRGSPRHRYAARGYPHRRCRLHCVHRSRARLCLRLSDHIARSAGCALQSFSDVVLLVVHLHVCGHSLLPAVPALQTSRSRERGIPASQGTRVPGKLRLCRPAVCHCGDHAPPSL